MTATYSAVSLRFCLFVKIQYRFPVSLKIENYKKTMRKLTFDRLETRLIEQKFASVSFWKRRKKYILKHKSYKSVV